MCYYQRKERTNKHTTPKLQEVCKTSQEDMNKTRKQIRPFNVSSHYIITSKTVISLLKSDAAMTWSKILIT